MKEDVKIKRWQDMLKQLKLAYIERTAPNFFFLSGGYSMRVNPYSDKTANGLTKCIEDFIKHIGGYANRTSTTGMVRVVNGVAKWTKGNTNKGAFDLRFVYQGKSVDVEVKIGRDVMSDAQEKEMTRIIAAGGLAFIAKDFPSFLYWFCNVFPDAVELLKPYGIENLLNHQPA